MLRLFFTKRRVKTTKVIKGLVGETILQWVVQWLRDAFSQLYFHNFMLQLNLCDFPVSLSSATMR